MRANLWRLVIVAVLLGGVAAFDSGTDAARAEGAAITETGWWSRSPGSATPPGGFQVGKTPEGELSVAAIRIQVDEPLSRALLILPEAPGGFLPESGVIDVCVSTAPWTAAAPGPLEEAPATDCATTVPLERNATAGSWTADVSGLLPDAGSSVTLVLKPGEVTEVTAPQPTVPPAPVPVPVPGVVGVPQPPAPPVTPPPVATPVDPGFTVEFSRADLDAAGDGSSDPSAPAPSSSAGSIASSTGSGSFAPTFGATDTFATSSSPSLTPARDALPAATPQVSPSGAGGAGTAAAVESGLQPVAATSGPATPWGRLLLLVPLSAAIGAAGAMIRRAASGSITATP